MIIYSVSGVNSQGVEVKAADAGGMLKFGIIMGVLSIIFFFLCFKNTKERVAASKAILDFLGKTKSVTIVATHDYELTQNQLYENYHFNSVIEEDDIVFDYRIHKGICESSNAIALLSYLGYPRNLVERAQNYLNENR
mgnify:CR=1 FL=1